MKLLDIGTVLEFKSGSGFLYAQITGRSARTQTSWLCGLPQTFSRRLAEEEIATHLHFAPMPPLLALVSVNAEMQTGESTMTNRGIFPLVEGVPREPKTRRLKPGTAKSGAPEWVVSDPASGAPTIYPEPLPPAISALPTARLYSVTEYMTLLGEGRLADRQARDRRGMVVTLRVPADRALSLLERVDASFALQRLGESHRVFEAADRETKIIEFSFDEAISYDERAAAEEATADLARSVGGQVVETGFFIPERPTQERS